MLSSLQARAIIVELNGLETVISTLYQSLTKPLVKDDFDKLIGLSMIGRFIFGGDLNCKHTDWNSRLISSRGRKLARHADRNRYAISAPDRPTYYPYRQNAAPDVLDIFLHHIELLVDDVVALDELNSDHAPVLLTAKCSMSTRLRPDACHVRWDVFRQHLKSIELPSDSFQSTDALEVGIETFSNTLRSAKIAGQVCRPHEAIKHFPDLSDLITEKRQIRKRWQRYRNYEDKVELNRLTNLVHHQIREFRLQRFEEDVKKASGDGSFWKLANRVKGSRNNDNTPIQGRDGVIFDARGKATVVAECLEDQFRANEIEVSFRSHYNMVRRGVQQFRNTSFNTSIQPVSGNEVRKVIKSLKHNKAPGHDGVTNSMVKQLPCHFVNHLVVIFNSALRLQHFPDTWKKANVVTIPKQGKDPKTPQNRRPISLLSSLGKIYERILLKRLTCHVFTNNLVPEEQFGFMQGSSTTQQLLRLTELISSGLDRKWIIDVVFLDISQAYDPTRNWN